MRTQLYGRRKGHDVIFAVQLAESGSFGKLKDLSKASFKSLSVSKSPFFCPHSILAQQLSEISVLKRFVQKLTTEFVNLKIYVLVQLWRFYCKPAILGLRSQETNHLFDQTFSISSYIFHLSLSFQSLCCKTKNK